MKHLTPFKRRRLLGFSLPEVTISLGVTALGITSMLGLLPQSLSTIKKSGDLAAETRITQQIISTVTQSRWVDDSGADLLTTEYKNKRLYYDDQAVALEGANPGPTQSYVAQVTVANPDLKLPSNSSENSADPYMRRVTIKIANAGNGSFNFDTAVASAYHTYASVITRTGK